MNLAIPQTASQAPSPKNNLLMTQGRKILITGGTGNIGQLLARKLKDDGHFVCCLDLSEPSQSKRVDNVRYEAFDIRENKKLESLFKALQPDIVFHLASLLSGSSELDRRKAIDINLLSSFNLLELAVESATATFVFPGTGASYSPEVPRICPKIRSNGQKIYTEQPK